jgi:hypothetical protein
MKRIPNFIDVIRTYRKERGLSFEEAKREAERQFLKHGWPLPAPPAQKEKEASAMSEAESREQAAKKVRKRFRDYEPKYLGPGGMAKSRQQIAIDLQARLTKAEELLRLATHITVTTEKDAAIYDQIAAFLAAPQRSGQEERER